MKCMIFYAKFKNRLLPSKLQNMFTFFINSQRYELRHQNKILVENRAINKSAENSLRYFIPKFINNLPACQIEILNLNDITTIRSKLKRQIVNNYSIEECKLDNCYLFHPRYLSPCIQLISIFSYLSDHFYSQ